MYILSGLFQHTAARRQLDIAYQIDSSVYSFQHTAARRRLAGATAGVRRFGGVSTHSRPKAAGGGVLICRRCWEGFNTQPPEGGWLRVPALTSSGQQFQHTAARRRLVSYLNSPTTRASPSFNTQPPEGGWHILTYRKKVLIPPFQHTAARRRLVIQSLQDNILEPVSTHSRPKAAGAFTQRAVPAAAVSTHSRPKAAGS